MPFYGKMMKLVPIIKRFKHLVAAAFFSLFMTGWISGPVSAVEPLRFGVVSLDAPSLALRKYQPLADYLSQKLGQPVDLVPQNTWNSMILSLASSRLDYGIMSTGAYAAARHHCDCVEPLVKAELSSGLEGYHAIMITLDQGPVTALNELQERSVTVVGENSTGPHYLAINQLQKQGIMLPESGNTILFSDDIREAANALLTGKTDVLITWSWMDKPQNQGFGAGALSHIPEDMQQKLFPVMRLLWSSPPVPLPPHVVRINLADPVKNRLQEALLSLSEDNPELFMSIAEGNSVQYVSAIASDYSLIVEAMARAMP
jgi:phosphate/phosphite/phosphonate ABC transporter binding protein